MFRAWRRCREQGKLHFPCDGLRRLPFCTLAARERLAAASHSLPSSPNERNGGDTIAIYHCSIKIVSRGKGKSAVAAAAYRSGEKLTNEWDGLTHDYTKKGGVVHSEILLPAHAPPAFSDRSTLWNSVELSEKSNNAQLAREVEIALPVELSREEQTRLVREYCSSQFVSKGMIADFNLHDTGGGNPHAHILLTMRPLDEKGAWLPKSKKEYVLDENGERIRLPSGRYKTRKVDLVDWNNRENAEVWRRTWADLTNEFLAQNNCPERIDHRSYERQGIDQIPTVHVGVSATQMEKKGIVTERGELNRNINAANRILREIRRANDRIADPVLSQKIDRLEEVAGKIFRIIEKEPAKKGKAGTFLNYYLPTTLKLLNAYDRMGAQGVNGENIDNTMQRVESMMSTIVAAFEKQLDMLFGSEAMDISTDITVLENMMKREGLSEGDGVQASGGTATASQGDIKLEL